jgi:hypothetical protein
LNNETNCTQFQDGPTVSKFLLSFFASTSFLFLLFIYIFFLF